MFDHEREAGYEEVIIVGVPGIWSAGSSLRISRNKRCNGALMQW